MCILCCLVFFALKQRKESNYHPVMADDINPELHPLAIAIRQKLIQGGMILQQDPPPADIDCIAHSVGCASNIDDDAGVEDYSTSLASSLLAYPYPAGTLFHFSPMPIIPADAPNNFVGYTVRFFDVVFWQQPAAAAE